MGEEKLMDDKKSNVKIQKQIQELFLLS